MVQYQKTASKTWGKKSTLSYLCVLNLNLEGFSESSCVFGYSHLLISGLIGSIEIETVCQLCDLIAAVTIREKEKDKMLWFVCSS